MRGNCYVTCEALYHLLGGKEEGYTPMVMRHEGKTHWFLRNVFGAYIDPTMSQFKNRPDHSKGRGCGFLTKKPSKRAKILIKLMLWQK